MGTLLDVSAHGKTRANAIIFLWKPYANMRIYTGDENLLPARQITRQKSSQQYPAVMNPAKREPFLIL